MDDVKRKKKKSFKKNIYNRFYVSFFLYNILMFRKVFEIL